MAASGSLQAAATGSPVAVTLAELVSQRKLVPTIKRRSGKRVNAPVAGGTTSPALGRGLDFSEVREYQAGDDVRMIDWKVTARSGKPHTKLFTEERERPFFIALDLRPSMFFGTRVAYKSVYAARLCALLAWAAAKQGDRVGGLVFNNDEIKEIKPQGGSRGVTHLLQQIVSVQDVSDHKAFASRPLSDALLRLDRLAHTGSSVCLVSDFTHFDSGSHTANLLRRNHLAAIRVYDPLEESLPPPDVYTVTDGREVSRFNSGSERTRQKYTDDFAYRTAQLQSVFNGHCYVNACVTDDMASVASAVMHSLPGSG